MFGSADVVVLAVRVAFIGLCWRALLPFVRGAARASSSSSSFSSSSSSPRSSTTDLPTPAANPRRLPPSAPWNISLLFSLALEEPATMFVLVVADAALGPMARPNLRPLWHAACFTTAVLHAILIPLFLCGLGTGLWPTRFRSKVAWIATLIPFVGWTVLFLAIPVPSDVPRTIMAPALLRLCTVGAVLLGLLSGSAAAAAAADAWADAELWAPSWLAPYLGVNQPHESDDYIPLASTTSDSTPTSPPPGRSSSSLSHASALAAADAAVHRARQDMASKQLALAALEQSDHHHNKTTKKRPTEYQGWSGYLPSAFRSLPGGKDAAALRSELVALERITISLERDRSLVAQALARSQRASSWTGRAGLALDAVVGLYGALIILSTVFNLLISLLVPKPWRKSRGGTNATEHASSVLLTLLRWMHVPTAQLDPALLTHVTSLLVAGILISLRLRTVMAGLLRLGRYISSPSSAAGASSTATDGLALFLAQAGAAYLLAALLQLRTVLLPHHTSTSSTGSTGSYPTESTSSNATTSQMGQRDILSPVETGPPLLASLPPFEDAFGMLFDAAFLFAAVAAAGLSWVRRRAQERAY